MDKITFDVNVDVWYSLFNKSTKCLYKLHIKFDLSDLDLNFQNKQIKNIYCALKAIFKQIINFFLLHENGRIQ